MRQRVLSIFLCISLFATVPASFASQSPLSGKIMEMRGTVAISGWSLEYPDFAEALKSGDSIFTLLATAGNAIGAGDSADLEITDAVGSELLSSFGYAANDTSSIQFTEYLSLSDLDGIDITRNLKAKVTVKRAYDSPYSDATILFSIPVTSFPKKPVTASDFVTFQSVFTPIAFPKSCTLQEFQYLLNDPYEELSTVYFTLVDSKGSEIYTASGYAFEDGLQKDEIRLCPSDLAQRAGPFSIVVTLNFQSDSGKLAMGYKVDFPLISPKRPTKASEYVKINTEFAPVAYPSSCSTQEFQYTVADPYQDIDSISFKVIDVNNKEVTSTFGYDPQEGLSKESFDLCPFTLTGTSGPYSFITAVSFKSETGMLSMTDKIAYPLAPQEAKATAALVKMGDYCLKGKSSKVVTPGAKCPAGYKKVVFTTPSEVTWNSLVRMPNSQKGKNFLVYACVAQFDANTGGATFRGYASATPQEYYFTNGVNALFTGSAKDLLKLSENKSFLAKVSVNGGVSYTTTLGGKTTVPSLAIKQFQVLGSC
jgi:hypothetical protein